MKRNEYIIRLVVLLSLFLITKVNAQVFTGDLTLTTQAEVDAFNYTSVTGFLGIDDPVNGDITNLNGLSELISVGDYFAMANIAALTNIDGLSNLISVGGFLSMVDNDVLTNIDGLSNLSSVELFLNIFSNDALLNINGLYNLSSVGGDLIILQNTSLTEFCGLYQLLSGNGLVGSYDVSGNAVNPTEQEIIDGGPCPIVFGNLLLASQAEVDAFNYNVVAGILTIDESSAGNITNLDGLSELTNVGGNLVINNNSAFTSVDGLSNLSSIGGFLFFSQNASVLNLNGLSNLNSVGGDLVILQNTALTEFCGLYQLLSVGGLGGSYNVEGNAANPTQSDIIDLCKTVYAGNLSLTNQAEVDAFYYSSVTGYLNIDDGSDSDISNLNSLLELTSVGGGLYMFFNPVLTNIDGLSNLTSVDSLAILGNDALTNINGLSNLNSVGDDLVIGDNIALSNIDGLSNLSSVGGDLKIESNNSLTNITGLSNLTTVGGFLEIYNNDALTNIDGLSNLTSVASFFNIISNASLLNINGLSNLNSVEDDFGILNNTALSEFCGLYNLLFGSGLGGSYIVSGNGANPTELEIINGGPCTTDASENETGIPDKYNLQQNYPNPFNPSTVISWQLPSRSNVVLKVYDILGNEVATLINENKEAGYYETEFDGSALTSGLYIYRLTTENYISTKKMLMIK